MSFEYHGRDHLNCLCILDDDNETFHAPTTTYLQKSIILQASQTLTAPNTLQYKEGDAEKVLKT